jgi:hypothetical protein
MLQKLQTPLTTISICVALNPVGIFTVGTTICSKQNVLLQLSQIK